MAKDELDLSAQPSSLLESLARQEDELRDLGQHDHGHGKPIETVREAMYRNHRIVVRTTYSITVDDVRVEGHLGVSNDGQVHYHAVPNLGFSSAIDLVEKLIDTFPDDFGNSCGDDGESAHDHGSHEHGEDHS